MSVDVYPRYKLPEAHRIFTYVPDVVDESISTALDRALLCSSRLRWQRDIIAKTGSDIRTWIFHDQLTQGDVALRSLLNTGAGYRSREFNGLQRQLTRSIRNQSLIEIDSRLCLRQWMTSKHLVSSINRSNSSERRTPALSRLLQSMPGPLAITALSQ